MTNPAWLRLTKKEKIKAAKARKEHRRERIALGHAKSAQPRKRVVNKLENHTRTPKIDRHWDCGCIYHHDNRENSWTRVRVCNTCLAKERLAEEAAKKISTEKISAEEVTKQLAENGK